MKKFKDILNEEVIDTALTESTIERTTQLEEQFDNMLNEIYGVFDMWGSKYNASFIAKRCDPINYEIHLNDYIEEQSDLANDSINKKDSPKDTENVISDENEISEDISEDLDIISSNLKANVYLGVYDGVYYIKVGEHWEEIPADTYQEALDTYNDIVKSKSAEIQETKQTEIEDDTIIQEEQEIEIIRSNFEPEIYLGKSADKTYFISVRKR